MKPLDTTCEALKRCAMSGLQRVGLDSRIARNSFYLMSAEAIGRAINVLVALLLFRYLGPEVRGSLGFVMTYGILFGVMCELGITRATTRHIAREPGTLAETMGTLLQTRILICAFTFVLMNLSLLSPLAANMKPIEKTGIAIWSLIVICQAFRRNSASVFLGLEKMHYHAAMSVAHRLLTAVLVLWVVWRGYGLLELFIVFLLSDFLDALVAGWIARRKFAKPTWKWSVRPVLHLLWIGLPFALQVFATQVYYYIDVVMLRYFYEQPPGRVDKEIGLYQAAYQVVLALIFIPLSLMNALFPALSRSYKEDPQRLRSLVSYASRLLVLAGLPISAAFFVLRREYLGELLGPAYLPALPMLEVVAWTLPVVFLTTFSSTLLAAADRQGYVSAAWMMMALFNVVVNLYLVPRHGGTGAALATLATEVLGFLMMFGLCLRTWPTLFPAKAFLPILMLHAAGIALLVSVDGMHVTIRALAWFAYALPALLWARRLYRQRRAGILPTTTFE